MEGAEPPAATRSAPCRARAWRGWRAPDLLRSERRGTLINRSLSAFASAPLRAESLLGLASTNDPDRDSDPLPPPASDQQRTPYAVLGIIAPDVLLDWAKRLGLTGGKKVVLASEHEMTLAEDLAIYLPKLGRSHPLDRYARAAQFSPGSNEALVLAAMRHARFSVWRVERRHETAGLILRDVMR